MEMYPDVDQPYSSTPTEGGPLLTPLPGLLLTKLLKDSETNSTWRNMLTTKGRRSNINSQVGVGVRAAGQGCGQEAEERAG